MDDSIIKKVSDVVYRRFPDIAKKRPRVISRPNGENLLVYQQVVATETGAKMQQSVRVVVGEKGDILKITTSR